VGREEPVQQGGRLVGQHPAEHLGAVVEPPVAHHVPQGAHGTGARFPGPEHDPVDPGEHRRAGAHRAGLEGDDERAAAEAPVIAVVPGGLAQGEDLGVGGGVAVDDPAVVAGADDTVGPVDHGCDGVLKANDEPFIQCSNNGDCDPINIGIDAGTCSLTKRRKCFLPTITATGKADPTNPIGVATFCIPPTANTGINLTAGLPGPGRVQGQGHSVAKCDAVYGTTNASNALALVPAGRGDALRAMMLIDNVSHDNEHYGNIVTYMRINGLVPPSSGGGH